MPALNTPKRQAMNVKIDKLGLAAFVAMSGEKIIEATADAVVFDTSKSGKEWRTAYANSEFSRFNGLMIEIRNLQKGTD